MRRSLQLIFVAGVLASCNSSSSSGHKNNAPVLDAIAAQSVRETETLTFAVHATDPDGDTVALSATGLPSGATFDTGTFSWTPAVGTVGAYEVTFTASDASLTATVVVPITVGARTIPYEPAAAAAGPTSFYQFVANEDPDGDQPFPTAANVWDIDTDFSLSDGWDDQLDGALELYVGTNADPSSDPEFPDDQTYDEIAFSTPEVGVAQGLVPVTVAGGDWALNGTYTVGMAGTADTRLSQVIDLTAATAPITLSFVTSFEAYGDDIPMPTTAYRVMVRDGAGTPLETLHEFVDTNGTDTYSSDLSGYAGQTIALSFELVGGASVQAGIDDVSVLSGATEYVVNGDFETGDLTGWTTSAPAMSTSITSGARTLSGLTVTRSFFTLPTQKWGRWVDVFENTTAAEIAVNASYYTNLGSDSGGVIFQAADGKSISEFDGNAYDRDVGWVFGGTATSTPTVTFTSATTLGTYDGNDDIWVVYPITVPAGGRVAIVNFLVMTGIDTGSLVGTTIDTHPAEVDAVNAAIVAGYGVDPIYQDYMTAAQRAAVVNF